MPKKVAEIIELFAAGLAATGDSIDRVVNVREDIGRRACTVHPDPWDVDTAAMVGDMERLREDFERADRATV